MNTENRQAIQKVREENERNPRRNDIQKAVSSVVGRVRSGYQDVTEVLQNTTKAMNEEREKIANQTGAMMPKRRNKWQRRNNWRNNFRNRYRNDEQFDAQRVQQMMEKTIFGKLAK